MTSRETQNRILDAATVLFNEEGTAQVSGNRIAEAAGVSKGNLHYHFKTKEEVIFSIWLRIEEEIAGWQGDAGQPTVVHMAEITLRQYRLIWCYRFFYRELGTLLDRDPELKYRFQRLRRLRMGEILSFLKPW
ncbi:MAG: TetR/AcrR family transcriptional regulator [Parahaliea sp.]